MRSFFLVEVITNQDDLICLAPVCTRLLGFELESGGKSQAGDGPPGA